MNLTKDLYEIIFSSSNKNANKVFNYSILILILLNVVTMIIEPSINNNSIKQSINLFESMSLIVFIIEYILRFIAAGNYYKNINPWKSRLKYVITPMAIIDLLAILPFMLPFVFRVDLRAIRIVRLFRVFRILKFGRFSKDMIKIIQVLKNKSNELISSVFVVFTLMLMASTTMYYIESEAQPEVFRSVFDSMWWATATLTTVGYGDIIPITVAGKFLAALIAILGIGIVAIPAGIIASGFMELLNHTKCTCPKCGEIFEGGINNE